MIPAILIGRKGSQGFPGKNTHKVLDLPLCYYPMRAAKRCSSIGRVVVSTDDPAIMACARENDVEIIERPPHLCTNNALGEDAFKHAYEELRNSAVESIEFVVLMFCNCATVNTKMLNDAINLLRSRPDADSVVSVSRYNMWSPLRARKTNSEGLLRPFVPFETFGNPSTLNCDRDSQGDVLFADMGLSVVRPHCLEHLSEGLLPQKWMGQKILPLHQEAGCDVDYEWQIPVTEWWLRKYGEHT